MPPESDDVNKASYRRWTQSLPLHATGMSSQDVEDADTIRDLTTTDDRPAPDPAFARQLRQALMRAEAIPVSSQLYAAPGSPRAASQLSPMPVSTTRGGWQRIGTRLTAAALVLLTVIGGLLILGPGQSGRREHAPALPALVVAPPATPAPGLATEETLLAVTIPATLLPGGDRIAADFSHVTSPPGTTGTWRAIDSAGQPGLRILFVMNGTLTMRADGPAQVVRTDGAGTLAEVPAGAEVTLHTGDTWIGRNETSWEAVNPGTTRAELLLWALANLEDPTAMALNRGPGTWELRNYFAPSPGVTVTLAPATLRIRLVDLPVKSRIAAPEDGLQYGLPVLANAEGTPVVGPSIGNLPDGRVVNISRKPAQGYILSLESAPQTEEEVLDSSIVSP